MTGDSLKDVKQFLPSVRFQQMSLTGSICPSTSYLVVELSVQPVRVILRPPSRLLTPLPHLRKVVINPGKLISVVLLHCYYTVRVKVKEVFMN